MAPRPRALVILQLVDLKNAGAIDGSRAERDARPLTLSMGYISNRKEAVFAMYAVLSIGAVWTPALPTILPELGGKALHLSPTSRFSFHQATEGARAGASKVSPVGVLECGAIVKRFQQVNPKILLSIDRYPQDGKNVDMLPKLEKIVEVRLFASLLPVSFLGFGWKRVSINSGPKNSKDLLKKRRVRRHHPLQETKRDLFKVLNGP
ncbi:hypothetical protein TNCV_2238571 [Trichonephila clavipes]|nr:hypothetical protein TNCV_2238571 [Trichonephila clavipes]